MGLIKKIIIVWLIVWLPLASCMASVMPIYAGAASTTLDTTAQDALPDQRLAVVLPCHQAVDEQTQTDVKCTHCVLCHIAGSIIPPSIPVMPMTVSHDCPHAISTVNFVSFIPTLGQRPPEFFGF